MSFWLKPFRFDWGVWVAVEQTVDPTRAVRSNEMQGGWANAAHHFRGGVPVGVWGAVEQITRAKAGGG